MPDDPNNLPAKPPLPHTVAELITFRKSLLTRTLNHDVEDAHLKLWEHEEHGAKYRAYLAEIWVSESIEGSFVFDDGKAAEMIRDFAKANVLPLAARAKLHSIVKSLHVVCRRYGMSREERRQMARAEANGTNINSAAA